MIILLVIGLFSLAVAMYLAFVLPGNESTQEKQHLVATLIIGTRIKTYTGDIGTIHYITGKQLTIFFDDGNRKIIHQEHVATIIND